MTEQDAGTNRSGRCGRRWLAVASVALLAGALAVGGTVAAETGDYQAGDTVRETFLTRLAGTLGIDRERLDSAIETASGETIDAAVAEGRITERQAERLEQRLADGLPLGIGRARAAVGLAMFGHGDGLATVASTMGMTTEELRDALSSGSTLEEVIVAEGSTVNAVVDALVAEATTDLGQAVANGRLTQSQADSILANLPERLTTMIENGFPCRPWWHDHDHEQKQETEDTAPSATPTV